MAGHLSFEVLKKEQYRQEEPFFLEPIEKIEGRIIGDLERFLDNKELKFFKQFVELPEEYLSDDERTDGNYNAYFIKEGLKCNPDAVCGGRCCIEIHFKNNKSYTVYAVA